MLANALIAVIVAVSAGCEGDLVDPEKCLPAPLPETLPYEFQGKIFRIWGGDYFDIRNDQLLHYVCLQGIDSPKPGQPFYDEAREELRRITADIELRVIVTKLDDSKVAFVKAWIPSETNDGDELDVGLEMIKQGFGWFDGNKFEGSDDYQSAHAKAREAKLGLWSQPDPVPPWDFEAKK